MKNKSGKTGLVKIGKSHTTFTTFAAGILEIIQHIQVPCQVNPGTLFKGSRVPFIYLYWVNPKYLRIKAGSTEGTQIINVTFDEPDFDINIFLCRFYERIESIETRGKYNYIKTRNMLIYA